MGFLAIDTRPREDKAACYTVDSVGFFFGGNNFCSRRKAQDVRWGEVAAEVFTTLLFFGFRTKKKWEAGLIDEIQTCFFQTLISSVGSRRNLYYNLCVGEFSFLLWRNHYITVNFLLYKRTTSLWVYDLRREEKETSRERLHRQLFLSQIFILCGVTKSFNGE